MSKERAELISPLSRRRTAVDFNVNEDGENGFLNIFFCLMS